MRFYFQLSTAPSYNTAHCANKLGKKTQWSIKPNLFTYLALFFLYKVSQGHVIYLLKLGHPSNLFVNLLGILRADIGGNRNEGSLVVGTTSFVPIGTGCAELCGSQYVNTAVVTQQKILQIINC